MTYGCALSDPVMKAGYKKIPKRTQKAEREQMGAEDSDAPAPPPDPEIAKRAKKVERARVAREGIKRKMDERVAMGKEDVNVAKKKKKVAKKKIRLVLVEDDDDGEKLSGKGSGCSNLSEEENKIAKKEIKRRADQVAKKKKKENNIFPADPEFDESRKKHLEKYVDPFSKKMEGKGASAGLGYVPLKDAWKIYLETDDGKLLKVLTLTNPNFKDMVYRVYLLTKMNREVAKQARLLNQGVVQTREEEGDRIMKSLMNEPYDIGRFNRIVLQVFRQMFQTQLTIRQFYNNWMNNQNILLQNNPLLPPVVEEAVPIIEEEEMGGNGMRGKKLSGRGVGASTTIETPTLEDMWDKFLRKPDGERVKQIYDSIIESKSQLRFRTEEALERRRRPANYILTQMEYERELKKQFFEIFGKSIRQEYNERFTSQAEAVDDNGMPFAEAEAEAGLLVPLAEAEVMEGNGMRGGCRKCSHLLFHDVLF